MWAASLSCDSCGNECASACGTRHFRSCCFNYLKKKRSKPIVMPSQNYPDARSQKELSRASQSREPVFFVENIPEQWTANVIPSEFRNYPYEDMFENRLYEV